MNDGNEYINFTFFSPGGVMNLKKKNDFEKFSVIIAENNEMTKITYNTALLECMGN